MVPQRIPQSGSVSHARSFTHDPIRFTATVQSSERGSWLPIIEELQRAVEEVGDQQFLTVAGESFTFAEAWDRARWVAGGLTHRGVPRGGRVAILSHNRPEAVWAWFGALAAGCVDVPLNAEARGAQLSYFLRDSGATVLITTSALLAEIDADCLPPLVVLLSDEDEDERAARARGRIAWSDLMQPGAASPGVEVEPVRSRPGELASIVYTSGTTGPSKGVMWAHGYYPAMARSYAVWAGLSDSCSIYGAQPLYHLDARATVALALYTRGRTTLARRFSASRFWSEIDAAGANVFAYIGTMLQLLAKQDGDPRPAGSPVLVGIGTAIPAGRQAELESRWSVELLEGYGTTEIPLILAVRRGSGSTGTVGTPADGMQVQLVDDDDMPVPRGEPGVLCVRPDVPFAVTLGYWNKPEATADTFANLWFHTGDLLREREDGCGFEYVGRRKDSIRRRGENVSAWEVEQATLEHPDVLDCAAIGVPSDVGDEDVAVLVVLREESLLAAHELVEFMSERLARFALPRFVEVVAALPKTPSERVNKAAVRERGLSAAAVDLATR